MKEPMRTIREILSAYMDCPSQIIQKLWIYHTLIIIVYSGFGLAEYNSTERDGLVKLRDTFKNNDIIHDNWTGPPCQKSNRSYWIGVVCSEWHVTEIRVENLGLEGPMPKDAFVNLNALKSLSFRNNSISGALPDISGLVSLENIDFSINIFSGPISEYSMRNLQRLCLSDNQLNGSIPSSLVKLNELSELQLQNNHLSGSIPPFSQKNLTIFNVSNNNLDGPIPDTPPLRSFDASSFMGNNDLCGKPLNKPCSPIGAPDGPNNNDPCEKPLKNSCNPTGAFDGKNKSKQSLSIEFIILIICADAAALLAIALLCTYYYRRKQSKKRSIMTPGSNSTDKPVFDQDNHIEKKQTIYQANYADQEENFSESDKSKLSFFSADESLFDINDLLHASAELLGKGNFGTAYRARMPNGSAMVVKRMRDLKNLSKEEFEQNIKMLGILKHDNLVPLKSYYYSKEEKLLVHKYMPNGNLFDLIHGTGRSPLDWRYRLKIARSVAGGLAYLHDNSESQIPHGNVKSSNVLMDENNEAQLCDYGLAALINAPVATQRMVSFRSPEYLQRRQISPKSDVWSFGILLLELLTGRVPSHFIMHGQAGIDLPRWVHTVVREEWTGEIFDKEIANDKSSEGQMLQLLHIAMNCVDLSPDNRPCMTAVLKRLQEIKESDSGEESLSTNSDTSAEIPDASITIDSPSITIQS